MCISCIYCTCGRWFYIIHISTLSAFFLAGVLVRGCWSLSQLAFGRRQGTLLNESPPHPGVHRFTESSKSTEQQHNREALRSPEQHNYNKDLASCGIWTPPSDLSWCSPLEKLCAQANLLMSTSLALIGFLGNLPNIWCFVHSDAGTTQTTDFPPLCFDRIMIPGQWGLCKNTNTISASDSSHSPSSAFLFSERQRCFSHHTRVTFLAALRSSPLS